jgi:hypothetical protein
MTSATFDRETLERLERIRTNPNPRGTRWTILAPFRFAVAWGKRCVAFHRSCDRTMALDSARNVLAVIGMGTILADFGTMRAWMLAPCLAGAWLVWYLDYRRHF